MAKRGRVLRDPQAGRGLLMVEGKQYPFLMDGLWRSEVPARPGLVVNVDFDTEGNLNGITAVPEPQVGPEQSTNADIPGSGADFDRTIPVTSLTPIVAASLLLLSWYFLTAVSIHLPVLGSLDLTFWQVLGYVNAGKLPPISEVVGSPDPGVFGFVAILVLAGPLLPYFWKDQRALLGGVLPLGFLALTAYMLRASIQNAMAVQVIGGAQVNLHPEILHTTSLGLGAYISISLAIYFAVLSTNKFLKVRRTSGNEPARSQRAAA